MNQGGKKVVIIVVILLTICLCSMGYLYVKMQGSKEIMDLKEYYATNEYPENGIPLIINSEIIANKAYLIDKEIYIDQEIASTLIDSIIYWDANEKMLITTTPTDIVKVAVNSTSNIINDKTGKDYGKPLVKEMADGAYVVALSYIKEYANVEYKLYKNPNRVVVTSNWGDEITKIKVVKDDVIRYKGDKESDILKSVKTDEVLYVLQDEVHNFQRYINVMSADGIAGYILNKNIGKAYKEVVKNDYVKKEYPTNHIEGKVNLGWLSVSNLAANKYLTALVNKTSGLNVVSPTWFSVSSANGDVSSLASKDFVTFAHQKGLKVWVLVDDFGEVKLLDVMSKTTTRTNLINNLIASTKECNADGINVDFENITKESSPHYIQFLRELSIQCRANNYVLSVDSYVPLSYNEHYKIDEQGEFVDYVVIMAYDEHHKNSKTSGSVASLNYTQTAVDKAMAKVPKEKLVICNPFYSRLWGEKTDETGAAVVDSVETVSMIEGVQRVTQGGGTFVWDEETMQSYAEYIQNGKTYKIWLENSKSIAEKMKIITAADVAGVGSWRIGYETQEVWQVISTALTGN